MALPVGAGFCETYSWPALSWTATGSLGIGVWVLLVELAMKGTRGSC
jgi:hypothetical protein